jgi:glucose-1-phosphate thymidylyltransferase
MKGLILCAGKGTRLRPLTYSQPKTLLPVVNKPVLWYTIQQLIHVGIEEIGIVINPSQKHVMQEEIHRLATKSMITWIYQENPKGVADAVRQDEFFIGKEPFLLMLGDNLIQQTLDEIKNQVVKQKKNGTLMLSRVENPSEYGIALVKGDQIIRVEEKPVLPRSDLAVIGAYAFDSHIFDAINSISPSNRDEYEITDAVQWLIEHGYDISYSITDQYFSDVGTINRWLEANQWKMDELTAGQSSISPKAKLKECTIIHPVFIGDDCTLINATVGPYVSIGSGVTIEDCQVENSIVLEGACVKQIPFKIRRSVFGRYVQLINTLTMGGPGQIVLGDGSTMYVHLK